MTDIFPMELSGLLPVPYKINQICGIDSTCKILSYK